MEYLVEVLGLNFLRDCLSKGLAFVWSMLTLLSLGNA